MLFFIQEDITLLETHAGQPYDRTNTTHREIGQSLRRGVVAKTKHLAKLVIEQVQMLGYEVVLRHHWHDVDRVTDTPFYKPYTWASFTKPDATTDHIYFTLGVDGGRDNEGGKLVVKLNYQRKDPPGRQTSPNLTNEQRRTIQLFLDREGGPSIGWHTVLPSNVINYNWQTLAQWAADFIRDNNALYDETVRMIQIGGAVHSGEEAIHHLMKRHAGGQAIC
jgi:hypothetical protein